MPVTIFTIRATIAADKEDAFNDWYNNKHVPEVQQFNGAISARRCRPIASADLPDLNPRLLDPEDVALLPQSFALSVIGAPLE